MDIAGNIRNVRKFTLAPEVDAEVLRLAAVCKLAGYDSVRLAIDFGEVTTFNVYDPDLHSLVHIGGACCERVD